MNSQPRCSAFVENEFPFFSNKFVARILLKKEKMVVDKNLPTSYTLCARIRCICNFLGKKLFQTWKY